MSQLGRPAPEFSGQTSRGDTFKLSAQSGRVVVLFFFPAAFTPGCTKEASEFAKSWKEFEAMGAEVIGISPDTHETQCQFAKELKLPFPLITDVDSRISELYGSLWPLLGRTRRATFVIDAQGVIRNIFKHELRATLHVGEARDAASQLAASGS